MFELRQRRSLMRFGGRSWVMSLHLVCILRSEWQQGVHNWRVHHVTPVSHTRYLAWLVVHPLLPQLSITWRGWQIVDVEESHRLCPAPNRQARDNGPLWAFCIPILSSICMYKRCFALPSMMQYCYPVASVHSATTSWRVLDATLRYETDWPVSCCNTAGHPRVYAYVWREATSWRHVWQWMCLLCLNTPNAHLNGGDIPGEFSAHFIRSHTLALSSAGLNWKLHPKLRFFCVRLQTTLLYGKV